MFLITHIVYDLYKIDGFVVYSYKPFKSNLSKLMPILGIKIECEINQYIDGKLILLEDIKLRG